jgi:hypothetical protein
MDLYGGAENEGQREGNKQALRAPARKANGQQGRVGHLHAKQPKDLPKVPQEFFRRAAQAWIDTAIAHYVQDPVLQTTTARAYADAMADLREAAIASKPAMWAEYQTAEESFEKGLMRNHFNRKWNIHLNGLLNDEISPAAVSGVAHRAKELMPEISGKAAREIQDQLMNGLFPERNLPKGMSEEEMDAAAPDTKPRHIVFREDAVETSVSR